MKKTLVEVENEGFLALMDKRITVMCANYFYTGVLEGVNETCIKLTDPCVVYETGAWSKPSYVDEQKLPSDIYIQIASVEAFGVLNA